MDDPVKKAKRKQTTDKLGNVVIKEKYKYSDGTKFKAKTIKNNKGATASKIKDRNGKSVETNKFGGNGNDANWKPTKKDYKAIKYGARELACGGKLKKKK